VVARDEGALRRLAGSADQFVGKELGQRRFQFCVRIGFAVWGQKEPWVVYLACMAACEVTAVVQQEMPVPLLRESRVRGLSNQLLR